MPISIIRLGSLIRITEARSGKLSIINFDHHPDNTGFGTVNVVDPKKSSVAELVYDFFNFNGWDISKDVATCLLTGIITDTGGFMHSNTQGSTLKSRGGTAPQRRADA